MEDMTHHIRRQFPGQKHLIDRLVAEDPDFASLCEDYDACVNALRYWVKSKEPEANTRMDEYHTLVWELKQEIAQILTAFERQRLD